MCGRYFVYDETMEEAERLFEELTSALPSAAAGDITPGMDAPAVTGDGGKLSGGMLRWGFKGFEPGKLIINSRAESIWSRPMFRESMKQRRCVLPAAGFYEWDRDKQKAVFSVPDNYRLEMLKSIISAAVFAGRKQGMCIAKPDNLIYSHKPFGIYKPSFSIL